MWMLKESSIIPSLYPCLLWERFHNYISSIDPSCIFILISHLRGGETIVLNGWFKGKHRKKVTIGEEDVGGVKLLLYKKYDANAFPYFTTCDGLHLPLIISVKAYDAPTSWKCKNWPLAQQVRLNSSVCVQLSALSAVLVHPWPCQTSSQRSCRRPVVYRINIRPIGLLPLMVNQTQ